jgi:hypothetical protein
VTSQSLATKPLVRVHAPVAHRCLSPANDPEEEEEQEEDQQRIALLNETVARLNRRETTDRERAALMCLTSPVSGPTRDS